MFTLKSSHTSSGSAKRRGSGTSLAPKRRKFQLLQLFRPLPLATGFKGPPAKAHSTASSFRTSEANCGPGSFRGKAVVKSVFHPQERLGGYGGSHSNLHDPRSGTPVPHLPQLSFPSLCPVQRGSSLYPQIFSPKSPEI